MVEQQGFEEEEKQESEDNKKNSKARQSEDERIRKLKERIEMHHQRYIAHGIHHRSLLP